MDIGMAGAYLPGTQAVNPGSTVPQRHELARRIERDLILPGEAGAFLGRKQALMARYGVGRPALEMAIRELESRDLAEMRTGPAGGLYRCEGGYMPAALSLATYITLERVNHADVLDVHVLFYEQLVARAADVRNDAGKQQLRELIEAYLRSPHSVPSLQQYQSALWRCLTDIVGDPALSLALHSLEWIQRTIILNELPLMEDEPRLVQMVKAWDRRVVRAILAGEGEAAGRLARMELGIVRRHIDAQIAHGELPVRARLRTPFKSNRGTSTGKLAIPTARALLNRVVDQALPPGSRLGTIESLAAELGVSSEVMRQSIRLVQTYGLIRSMPGRQGGVFAGALCAAQTMQICAAHYAQAGYTRAEAGSSLEWLALTGRSRRLAPGAATIIAILRNTLNTYVATLDEDPMARTAPAGWQPAVGAPGKTGLRGGVCGAGEGPAPLRAE